MESSDAGSGMRDDTARSDNLRNMKKAQADGSLLPGFLTQLTNYAQLMRLDKPIGTWLLGWPTLWALWLAGEGHPDGGIFIVFVLGIVVMRSAGCVLNDFADRRIDPHVERTRGRPIASGAVAPMEALTLFVALALIAIGLAAMLNRQAHGIRLGGTNGVRGADRPDEATGLARLRDRTGLGRHLRHVLRDGRS
jgi:heme O synthase-like polyprenyltransferase